MVLELWRKFPRGMKVEVKITFPVKKLPMYCLLLLQHAKKSNLSVQFSVNKITMLNINLPKTEATVSEKSL